jgi:hypothetical protein
VDGRTQKWSLTERRWIHQLPTCRPDLSISGNFKSDFCSRPGFTGPFDVDEGRRRYVLHTTDQLNTTRRARCQNSGIGW